MMGQTKRLTARTVATLTKIGRHADGQNLYLKISGTGAALSKRWVFFYTFGGKQREAGLGSAVAVTLAKAREKAVEYRSLLAKGIDPLAQRRPPTTHGGTANLRPMRRCTNCFEAIPVAQCYPRASMDTNPR